MKGKSAIAAVMLLLLAAGAAAGLYAMKEENISSIFETGGINIALEQRMEQGERNVPFSAQQAIVPGQKISMIPKVVNKAESCYVRVSVAAGMDGQAARQVNPGDFYGQTDKWVRQGQYLYYTEVLAPGQEAEICQGIRLPNSPQTRETSQMNVDIKAEAVQSRNLQPDFQSQRPWGRIETEFSQVNGNYQTGISERTSGNGVDLVYEAGAKSYIENPEAFFSDIGVIMPGDKCSDSLRLKNSADREVCILFKATSGESALLEKASLLIRNGGKTVYNGPLACTELRNYRLLTTLSKDETQNLTFDVKAPAELRNTYQELSDQVTWWFAVRDVNGKPIQTGDGCSCWSWVLLMLSLAAAVWALIKRRKRHGKML